MKKLLYLLSVILVCSLSGCKDSYVETVTYKVNEPVLMPLNAFRNSVVIDDQPREIAQIGKICFYNGYLYISDPEKGIHIVDNQIPSNPKVVGYIELIGNADLAIRNNMLYADSYIDLVWFDITNPAKPVLKDRLEEVFVYSFPVIDNFYGYEYNMVFSEDGKRKGVVVGWNLVEKTREVEGFYGGGCYDYVSNSSSGVWAGGATTGLNGSMSRFGLYKDNLYTVIDNVMTVFDLSGDKPVKALENFYIGRDVETIFNYKDYMFLGTPTGMLIYSVENPLSPEWMSSLQHIYGCDPVVVENDLAYVTIRSGNLCGQDNNELFIVDVSDVKSPRQIVSYTMNNPKGLGIDNGTLFLCDEGLKIYKVEDPQTLMSNRIAHYSGMDGFDVIANNNVLMMIADDGLYQYDYSKLNEIKQISKLSLTK